MFWKENKSETCQTLFANHPRRRRDYSNRHICSKLEDTQKSRGYATEINKEIECAIDNRLGLRSKFLMFLSHLFLQSIGIILITYLV